MAVGFGKPPSLVTLLQEWLKESQAKLAVVGMLGPLEGKSFSVDLNTNVRARIISRQPVHILAL